MQDDIGTTPRKPNYGIDAPGAVRNLAVFGTIAIVLGTTLSVALRGSRPDLAESCLRIGRSWGLSFLFAAAFMIWGSKRGKLTARDRLLDAIPWRGDETVLDVGCGRGLLLIGAAKRLTSGKAVGIDIWQSKDLSGNRPEATIENARLEGVESRVEVRDGDARKMPFDDAIFDVVVSSMAIHNIWGAAGRAQAVLEIARVLKPGGIVAILDVQCTREYARTLRACGFEAVERSRTAPLFVISRVVRGRKPVGVAAK